MNTLDEIERLTKHNDRIIKDLFAMIEDWRAEQYELCIKYCMHRSSIAIDPKTNGLVCSYCGKV